MANHAIINGTHASFWDVDAMNEVGLYTSDLDNGVLVTLDGMNVNSTSGVVEGYEYNVAPATATSTVVYLVATPPVGSTLEMAYTDDPRYFYNVAGRPMSLKYMHPMVDCIEIDAAGFASGDLPVVGDIDKFVGITTGGKLDDPDTTAPVSGAYFRVEGLHHIDCGLDIVPTVILRCIKN